MNMRMNMMTRMTNLLVYEISMKFLNVKGNFVLSADKTKEEVEIELEKPKVVEVKICVGN